ncbi:MAG: ATP-binding protein [Chloroflexales bacterium]
MTSKTILIVEDEAVIARDLQFLLEDLGYCVSAIATTADEALMHIGASLPDLVLLDIRLADGSDGITVAETILTHWEIPVIFLTAHADAATVARAAATVPYGYLLKPFHEREVAIGVQMALAKSASDQRLRVNERLFSTTLHSIAEGIIIIDATSRVAFLNPAAESLTGWSRHEAVGRSLTDVFVVQSVDGCAPISVLIGVAMEQGRIMTLPENCTMIPRTGAVRYVANSIALLVDAIGRVQGAVIVFQDVTAQRDAAAAHQALESKLVEAQRLESLGLLAGSIAHDFNNILTSVLGHVDLAIDLLPTGSEANVYLARASSGIWQAASLTKQLMTYAGKDEIHMGAVSLNTIVSELIDLLHGSLMRSVDLHVNLEANLPPVRGDSTQIRQVAMNLLINAAESSTKITSQVTVSTSLAELTPALREHLVFGDVAAPGPHLCLSVCDTGDGMAPATLTKIFDPFFTTKITGRGLGLAAVQGIVRQHRGALRVTSAVGQGTTFEVFLPVDDHAHVGC